MDAHYRRGCEGTYAGHIGRGGRGQFREPMKSFTLNPDAPVFTLSAEAKEFVPRSASNQYLANVFSPQGLQNQMPATPVIPQPQMRYINHPVILKINELVVELTYDPNKFDQVARELTPSLRQVTDVFLVKEVITVIFEQGIGEVHFRYSGARLCQYLAKNITQSYKGHTFESLLLQRCHEEFSVCDIYMVNEASRVCGFTLFLAELFTQVVTTSSQPLGVLREWLCQLQQTILKQPTDNNLKTVAQVLMVVDNNIEMEKATTLEIPEDEIDPLKLFVGNLRQNVNKYELLATLNHHANVTSAFIVKKKFKGRNYGFISLPTEDDMKKIMDLNNKDCFLSGSKLIFRPTCKRFIPPGVEGFVRQPLPDRDYDLSPLDPNKPSIHVLVDDVMMKILKYLPLNERILCEVVCRRWQSLLYVMFESTPHLNLSADYINQNSLYDDMLSKMLLFTGENLKYLSLSDSDFSLKENIFLIIGQLCPNLEYLDLSNDQSLCFDNVKALKDCNNLKCFSANRCSKFDENAFEELISVLPCLEKIYVSFTSIKGHCFNILPEGLKELNISFCPHVYKDNLHKVSKACKSLEVLEIENINADKKFLEELGVNCTNLRCLKFNIAHGNFNTVEVSNQVKVFTKLTHLKVVTSTFELSNIAENVKDLEELDIKTIITTRNMVDFGKFIKLKNVVISSPFCKQELMSLEKCRNLQYVTIDDFDEADQETIRKIVIGCPEIKHINCPKVCIDIKFITDINEIMKNRSKPIKFSVINRTLLINEMLDPLYDTKKINFDFVEREHFLCDEDSDYDFDEDEDSDYDFDEDFYNSDDSLVNMDNFFNARVGILFEEDEEYVDEDVDENGFDKRDIEMVMSMAKVTRATAVTALKKHKNDIVMAIMELSK